MQPNVCSGWHLTFLIANRWSTLWGLELVLSGEEWIAFFDKGRGLQVENT